LVAYSASEKTKLSLSGYEVKSIYELREPVQRFKGGVEVISKKQLTA